MSIETLNVESLMHWLVDAVGPFVDAPVTLTAAGPDFVINGPLGASRTFCGELADAWHDDGAVAVARQLLERCLDTLQDYICECSTNPWPPSGGAVSHVVVREDGSELHPEFVAQAGRVVLALPALDLTAL